MRKILLFAALIFSWSLAAAEGVLDEHRVKFGDAELIINAAGEVQMLLNGKPFIKKDHVSVSQNGKFLYSTEWTREPVVIDFNEENGVFTFYFHSAKEGRKLDILKVNPAVCLELDWSGDVVESNNPCAYGYQFASVIAEGNVEFLEKHDDKAYALNRLMLHMTGKEFAFSPQMTQGVCVYKVTADTLSCKIR